MENENEPEGAVRSDRRWRAVPERRKSPARRRRQSVGVERERERESPSIARD